MSSNATSDAPIFIVGHPRSGTTLLRLILNAHPRIVIPPEGHLVSFLRRCESKYGALSDPKSFAATLDRLLNKERMREWGFDESDARARCEAGEHTPGGIFASMMSLWTDQSGKPRWGEKTPGTYRFIPDVDAWFPKCQVIHIIRDARDVAVSNLNPPFSDRYDKGNEYEVALRWRDAVRRGRVAAESLGPERYFEFRYEDLTDDPEAMARRLAAFLGEDYDPAMMNYHERATGDVPRGEHSYHQRTKAAVDKGRVERWRTDASREFVMRVEGIAGTEMKELGYELSGWQPSVALRAEIAVQKLKPRNLIKNYRSSRAPRRS